MHAQIFFFFVYLNGLYFFPGDEKEGTIPFHTYFDSKPALLEAFYDGIVYVALTGQRVAGGKVKRGR